MIDHDWKQFFDRAHEIDILSVAQGMTKLRHEGRDWSGPCPRPGCAKTDGFVVTPSSGLFVCRPSGDGGDVVTMVQHAQGCSVGDALEFILGESVKTREETPAEKAERERKWAEAQAEAQRRAEERRKEAEIKDKRSRRTIGDILARAVPIAGTHAEAYLRDGRKLPVHERLCRDLLFVPDLDYYGYACTEDEFARQHLGFDPHRDDQPKVVLATLPALVARVRDADGQDGFAIHQTYLDPVEPRKWRPPVDPDRNAVKKFRGSSKAGLIRFGRPTRTLAIGEGIETTFGWYGTGQGGDDVSIAASCGSFDKLTPAALPACVKELILLVDRNGNDPAGMLKKVQKAGRAIGESGRTVLYAVPPDGMDWADVAERGIKC